MKSILKIQITGLDYYTLKKCSFNRTITCHGLHFNDKVIPAIPVNGGKYLLPEHINTAQYQADEWFSKQSKLLDEIIFDFHRELKCILTWRILSVINVDDQGNEIVAYASAKSKRTQKDDVSNCLTIIEKSGINDWSDETKANFAHIYQEMKDELAGLSVFKKIQVVMSAMGVAYQAASNAYNHISNLIKDGSSDTENNEPMYKRTWKKPLNPKSP